MSLNDNLQTKCKYLFCRDHPALKNKRMAKDFVINTSRVNSYGTRVLTSGIDLSQFERNPLLLFMHRRAWDDKSMPIGRVENIRVEGDELRGTPVFDLKDPFAAEVARKWDEDFIRMCSAGIEPVEYSTAPEHLMQGQTRATLTRSKLIEVSIVDIGANDDALRLYEPGGKFLQLASGVDNDFLPLLKPEDADNKNDKQNLFTMNKILLALGLAPTATEDEAVSAINALKENAQKADNIELARITDAVDEAIKAKKTTADKRDHFIALGKAAGFESLKTTLAVLTPSSKPTDVINHTAGSASGKDLKFTDLSDEQAAEMREKDRAGYIRLFKAEFGFEPEFK